MKLPEPDAYTNYPEFDVPCYTADQMRQYRIDALEEAAQICDTHYVDDVLEDVWIAKSCGQMIRALKEKKHE